MTGNKSTTTIHTLSPELISEVFRHCLSGLPLDYISRARLHAPLLLGRVCSR
ncbi:hypothetical protein BD410DRAFT_791717 [Rickenella mellea]|uniref:Uncharacterized protein n=1 Tax=Rickenella mellea TaxID=50990 RepID=A0A4Y7PXF9_9AGAM|nr:hypothetical protein BD410DRAFT_791717 [Rickenella mellea]